MSDDTATDEVSFDWNGLTLVGTLHRPTDVGGRNPTVLMLQGSGPSDRNSDGFFEPIRAAFLDRGIATFAFDKPGCGSSTGDWRRYGLEARADQATAALATLNLHAGVEADRVGIFGHSQGGWLAQMLAARMQRLPFAIAASAPSIGVAAQNLHGCEHTLRNRGFRESDIAEALAFLVELHAAAQGREAWRSVEARLIRGARRQPWYGYLSVDDEAEWAEARLWITEPYDPAEALRRIRCPFLAVYGALDPLLPPWRSAQETAAALLEAGAEDATVVVMPTGNHRMQVGDTEAFVPGYLDLLGDWAARRATAGRVGDQAEPRRVGTPETEPRRNTDAG